MGVYTLKDKQAPFLVLAQILCTDSFEFITKISLSCLVKICLSVWAHLVPVGLPDFIATGFV